MHQPTREDIQAAWDQVGQAGWNAGHPALVTLYPMPGHARFEDDRLFADIPILPKEQGVIRAGDPVWNFPAAWFQELETRSRGQEQCKFDIIIAGKMRLSMAPSGAALIALLQKAAYLEVFRARRPIAVSTLRFRLRIYGAFIRAAVLAQKPVPELDYADLVRALDQLGDSYRGSVPAVYDTLRWWKAQSGAKYPFFDLPPSLEALLATGSSEGFDPTNVRADGADLEGNTWQPLPDEFVAAAGKIVIDLIEVVRPTLLTFLSDVAEYRRQHGEMPSELRYREMMRQYQWPSRFAPRTTAEFRRLCRQSQTATMILLSLLLGLRASELLSLPRGSIRRNAADGDVHYTIDGSTFKFSQKFGGERRDWPVHDLLRQALEQQETYIDITEGPEFPYLWKQHSVLFGSRAWLRDTDGQLDGFVQRFDLGKHLEGSRCHHHRFRKTTARLIVISLYGGPIVLRRLFGHQHLAMTLRYILANRGIIDELREIAEEEQRVLAESYVYQADKLLGKGGDTFRNALSAARANLSLTVPDGKREQAKFSVGELVALLAESPEGLTVKQVIPGLLACFKPRDEAGACCTVKELPNVAKCSAECKWQLMLPEFGEKIAASNVEDALKHLEAAPDNPLIQAHYRGVVGYWVSRFPELGNRHRGRQHFEQIMRLG